MDFESQIEKIAKDIRDREDREMAYELVKRLSPLLIANGVTVKTTKYNLDEQVAVKEASSVDPFKKELVIHYGISIDGLDFTEHDKRFNDEIEDLRKSLRDSKDYITQLKHDLEKTYNQLMEVEKDAQERIAELESELEVKDNLLKIKNGLSGNDVELPCEPISVANMLINAKIEYEPTSLQKALFKTDGKCLADKYSDDDLEQIAEHLLLYCKHNRESE